MFSWRNAITNWMQQHQGHKVSLWQLQQALGMPLVEIWLGLLHSPTPYQWERQGDFYREARDIWIGKRDGRSFAFRHRHRTHGLDND